jgi:hypothetical protein
MIKRKLFLIAITIPLVIVGLVLVPILSCLEGMYHAYKTCIDSFMQVSHTIISAHKEAWVKPKESEKNMWDDQDTWGAQ